MFPVDDGKPPPGEVVAQAKLVARSKAVRLQLPSWSASTSYTLHGQLAKTECGPHRGEGLTVLLSGETLTNGGGLAEVALNSTMSCGGGTIVDRQIIDEVTFVAAPISDQPVFATYTIDFAEAIQYGEGGEFDPAVIANVTVRTWRTNGKPAPFVPVSWQAIVQNPQLTPAGAGG